LAGFISEKKIDTVADNLIFSIFGILEQKMGSIKATLPGGFERRTAKLCLLSGRATFISGDKSTAELFILLPIGRKNEL